jgi:hypothetical protein
VTDADRDHDAAEMGTSAFALLLTIGAAFLAIWLDQRLGDRRPDSPWLRVVHAFVAFVVLQLATAGFAYVVHLGMPRGQRVTALFLLYLPGLIYAFLASLWLMRTFADVARLTRR